MPFSYPSVGLRCRYVAVVWPCCCRCVAVVLPLCCHGVAVVWPWPCRPPPACHSAFRMAVGGRLWEVGGGGFGRRIPARVCSLFGEWHSFALGRDGCRGLFLRQVGALADGIRSLYIGVKAGSRMADGWFRFFGVEYTLASCSSDPDVHVGESGRPTRCGPGASGRQPPPCLRMGLGGLSGAKEMCPSFRT